MVQSRAAPRQSDAFAARHQIAIIFLPPGGSAALKSCVIEICEAGIKRAKFIDIYNVNNGERFTTYIILAEAGSGIISMNGAAARKCQVGDRIIIATYSQLDAQEQRSHKPQLVYLDQDNRIERSSHDIATQLAG